MKMKMKICTAKRFPFFATVNRTVRTEFEGKCRLFVTIFLLYVVALHFSSANNICFRTLNSCVLIDSMIVQSSTIFLDISYGSKALASSKAIGFIENSPAH